MWEPADWKEIKPQLMRIRILMSYGFNNTEVAAMTGMCRRSIQRYVALMKKEYWRQKSFQISNSESKEGKK